MKVAVWDTYVKRGDGKTMHFDILVDITQSDESKVFEYGRNYLKSKSVENQELTSKECAFCHIEEPSESIANEIETNGYYIIEMEHCNQD